MKPFCGSTVLNVQNFDFHFSDGMTDLISSEHLLQSRVLFNALLMLFCHGSSHFNFAVSKIMTPLFSFTSSFISISIMTGKSDYSPSNVSQEDISGAANVAYSPLVYILLRIYLPYKKVASSPLVYNPSANLFFLTKRCDTSHNMVAL